MMSNVGSGGLGDPILRLALRTLPPKFRRDYGDEILSFHRDRLADCRTAWKAARIWSRTMVDVLWHAVAERSGQMKAAARALVSGDSTMAFPSAGGPGRDRPSGIEAFASLLREFRYAFRGLARSRGFTLAFVLTLGLGIGANTAIFSVVSGVLLRPLPHDGGDRIVYLRQNMAESAIPNVTFSVPEIRDYREGSVTLTGIAEFSALTFTMLSDGEPRRVRSGIVSGNYFGVMGLAPVIGRAFTEADDPENASPVMMLTYDFWVRAFNADPSIVGETVRMNGRTIDIVGVLEPVPDYPERIDVLVNTVSSPHHMSAAMGHDREHRMTQVFARLAPGQTVQTAKAELDGIAQRLVDEYPETFIDGAPAAVTVTPLKDALTQRARLTLLVLLGAAGFVLVIACANVANLTLTRGIKRERELNVRAVLGASRTHLRRLLLIENVILSAIGAGLGLLLARSGMDLLIAYAERFTPRASEIAMDGTVLIFTISMAIGAALLFAFVPRLPHQDALNAAHTAAGTRTTGGATTRRLQSSLVVAQLAVSFVLLIGAGLFLKTLLNLQRIDPGFDMENVLTMEVPVRTAGRTSEQVQSFYDDALSRIEGMPGVTIAAFSSLVPLSSSPFMFEVGVEGYQADTEVRPPLANFRSATPNYFSTVGTSILQGRDFAITDRAEAAKVAIINKSMADYYFPNQEAVGRRLRWTDPQFQFIGVSDEWRTIVGIVADSRDFGLDTAPVHSVFQPLAQEVWPSALFVRTSAAPAALTTSVVRIIRSMDPDQPIENIKTLGELRASATAPKRLNATLVGAFAVLALSIAAVGVSGVLAFSVSRRTNEFGIRLTLGADQQKLISMILKEGGVLVGVGLLIGVTIALAISQSLSGMLFGVESTDFVTFLVVAVLLAGVSLAASFAPAWRASRIAPSEALRAD